MTQAATLRALDAELMAAFTAAGLADSAIYTPTVGAPHLVSVYIDRGVSYQGIDGQIRNDAVVITAMLDEIGDPPSRGAIFTVGSQLFKVESVQTMDESRVACVVMYQP